MEEEPWRIWWFDFGSMVTFLKNLILFPFRVIGIVVVIIIIIFWMVGKMIGLVKEEDDDEGDENWMPLKTQS